MLIFTSLIVVYSLLLLLLLLLLYSFSSGNWNQLVAWIIQPQCAFVFTLLSSRSAYELYWRNGLLLAVAAATRCGYELSTANEHAQMFSEWMNKTTTAIFIFNIFVNFRSVPIRSRVLNFSISFDMIIACRTFCFNTDSVRNAMFSWRFSLPYSI